MRIGILIDGQRVTRWQEEALRSLGPDAELIVYNCVNSRPTSRKLRHALYYLLNSVTVRNRLTRSVEIEGLGLNIGELIDFKGCYEGSWQSLPEALLDRIAEQRIQVIVKFSSALLRMPEPSRLPAPILSYHHGDPRSFRGRPAGFYELLHDAPVMGQIVQILSNKLDAGKVVGFAETKLHRHSYRATLLEAYGHSPLLLKPAIEKALQGAFIDMSPTGKLFRLPATGAVLKFVLARAAASMKRLFYGAFMEKAWKVSEAGFSCEQFFGASISAATTPEHWKTLPVPKGYRFLADPFFHPASVGEILVEALNASTGLGEVLAVRGGEPVRLSDPRHHYSYPGAVAWKGRKYIVPEISEWSEPRIYELDGAGLCEGRPLKVSGNGKLLDPTLFVAKEAVYLFANRAEEGANVLRLWQASDLFEEFVEHPASPVRISPEGSRMAGAIISDGSRIYRLGQDGRADYGDGIVCFEVERLDPSTYKEKRISEVKFAHVAGPHTLNFSGEQAIFDWYIDRFSPAAGLRRIRGRLARL